MADDLLTSTARQLALYDALGYPRPTLYAHVPLVVDREGARLSKRNGAAGIETLRAAGYTAAQLLGALAASCGLWPAASAATPAEILADFDPSRLTAAKRRSLPSPGVISFRGGWLSLTFWLARLYSEQWLTMLVTRKEVACGYASRRTATRC